MRSLCAVYAPSVCVLCAVYALPVCRPWGGHGRTRGCERAACAMLLTDFWGVGAIVGAFFGGRFFAGFLKGTPPGETLVGPLVTPGFCESRLALLIIPGL